MPGSRDVYQRGDWTVVEVSGDLDLATAPALRQEVLALLGDGRRRLVVDLGPADFVDSVGLGMLVAILKRVRVQGGELALACPEPRLQRVFRVVDLDRILTLHPSVEAALEAAAPAGGTGQDPA